MRIVKAYAAFAGMLLSLGASAPANAAASDWITFPPKPAERVIEVVDWIPGDTWNVRAAVNWLDKRTASDMRIVRKCSGTAYRCITFRAGRVGQRSAGPVGWSQGSTITIDTAKAKRGAYRSHFGRSVVRTWLLTHELGHQFGLKHSSGRNLMNEYVTVGKMKLTTAQRAHLRKV